MSEPRKSNNAHQKTDAFNRVANEALAAEIAALDTLSRIELRIAWRCHFRIYPPKRLSRDLLALGIAWKLQERALGGLSATAKRRLDTFARDLDTKSDIAKSRRVSLRPGARLIRDWHGETHEVIVTDEGFCWRGKNWRSLSLIAREITGTRWSGPRFFGLGASEKSEAPAKRTRARG